MNPTLVEWDYIGLNKLAYNEKDKPLRGDIVVFDRDILLVKRIVGVGGDTISVKNAVLYINGKPLQLKYTELDIAMSGQIPVTRKVKFGVYEETFPLENGGSRINNVIYLDKKSLSENYQNRIDNKYANMDEVIVPDGKYFVMGDNRFASDDSRVIGFINEDEIMGRVTHVLLNPVDIFNRIIMLKDKVQVRFFESVYNS